MKLMGIGASGGAAVARIFYLENMDLTVTERRGLDPAEQLGRFRGAVGQAKSELAALYEHALSADAQTAAVFEVHQMLLEDPEFADAAEEMIGTGASAEWAVQSTAAALRAMFDHMEDEYFRARGADVTDVSRRVLRILLGVSDVSAKLTEPVIVAATDLLPSQTVRLDRDNVVGFVTQLGSNTSHSVILARTMGIPCVVSLGDAFLNIPKTGVLAIDGGSGEVLVNPTSDERAAFEARIKANKESREALERYRGREAVSPSGKRVLVAANIGSPSDAALALKNDADGIGLFRSEFLYLESSDFPDEHTQFEAYKSVLSQLAPRPVVIRTLDFGSDKQAPYYDIGHEENPALGFRAIRICLKRKDIFTTQLRALLRASVYGRLCVMFPMISHLEQVLEIKSVVAEVKEALTREGVPFAGDVEFGIMVETPAAAVISDQLAKEVDFFSLGTNDLTQYTLAVDRTNGSVHELFDSAHPAVLRLIEMTVKSAHENGIWVGICGESAANTRLTDFYLSIGIDELSVSPASVLAVKRAVIESRK